MKACLNMFFAFVAVFCFSSVSGYSIPRSQSSSSTTKPFTDVCVDRRESLPLLAGASLASLGFASSAMAAENDKPDEFKNVGTQAPAPVGESPFVTLSNGVKVKDFRPGSGDSKVKEGSKVSLQITGRLLNLNGVVFYDSKKNDPDGFGQGLPVSFTVGDGRALPGLEAGIMGMQKGGVRRIIVPPELGYTKFPGLEPVPFNAVDQRALDSVIKNPRRDATLLFDCKLERLK